MNLPPHRSVRALIRTRPEYYAACAGCGSILSNSADLCGQCYGYHILRDRVSVLAALDQIEKCRPAGAGRKERDLGDAMEVSFKRRRKRRSRGKREPGRREALASIKASPEHYVVCACCGSILHAGSDVCGQCYGYQVVQRKTAVLKAAARIAKLGARGVSREDLDVFQSPEKPKPWAFAGKKRRAKK